MPKVQKAEITTTDVDFCEHLRRIGRGCIARPACWRSQNGESVRYFEPGSRRPQGGRPKAGGTIDVCDAYIVDDAGEIKLTLWGDDIPKVNDGSKVKITNGYTNTFKGEVSLTKGKYGQLEVLS